MTQGSGIGASFDPDRIAALRAALDTPGTRTTSVPASPPPPGAKKVPRKRASWQTAALLVGSFAIMLYVLEFVDVVVPNHPLDQLGIEPREADGLWGIAFAPVLHFGWEHLIANTIPVLILGFLTLVAGIARGIYATAIIWVVGGVGVWLTGGAGTNHAGASVLIFGWLTYLLARGLFTRSITQILIGLAVLAVYGGVLWGVLPSDSGVSWQGHLFGAIGGLIAAWAVSSDDREARKRRAVAA
jgi:membrane associated rhomboid family serine protease